MVVRESKVGITESGRVEVLVVPQQECKVNDDRRSKWEQLDDLKPMLDRSAIAHIAYRACKRKNKTGYCGVNKINKKTKGSHQYWTARIRCYGRMKYLGAYRSPHWAARAYDKAATILYGDDAVLNFPKEKT